MAGSPIRRRGAARTSVFVAGSAALVLGLPGCGSSPYYAGGSESVEVCYDKATQVVVDDDRCDDDGGHTHFVHGYYHSGSYVPRTGEKITARGASPKTSARSGTSTVRGSSVSRGGFGTSHGSVGG